MLGYFRRLNPGAARSLEAPTAREQLFRHSIVVLLGGHLKRVYPSSAAKSVEAPPSRSTFMT